jgi:hypothetical protein
MSYMNRAKAKMVRLQSGGRRDVEPREGRNRARGRKNLITPSFITENERLNGVIACDATPCDSFDLALNLSMGTDSGNTSTMKSKLSKKQIMLMTKTVDTVLEGRKCRMPPAIWRG